MVLATKLVMYFMLVIEQSELNSRVRILMVQEEESGGEELFDGNRPTFDLKTLEGSQWRMD